MNQSKIQDFLTKNISQLKNVGPKTKILLKKKKIDRVIDLLWTVPKGFTDRTKIKKLNELEIGEIATIKVKVIKYNFPRIRNLPNKISCSDDFGEIDIIFFNSREGYIKKILKINSVVIISGKVNYYKKKYQISNPAYIAPVEDEDSVNKLIPKYSLTEGLSEKVYIKLVDSILKEITNLEEWHDKDTLKKIGNVSWSQAILNIHQKKDNHLTSKYYKRLAYDEILANLLVLSEVRKRIKKDKKVKKFFNNKDAQYLIDNLGFKLTNNQNRIINEINLDLKSNLKMFRLLQGDVGSGKTIISFVAALNTIKSKWQVGLMAPTEILAKQHFELAKKIFKGTNVTINFLTGKTDIKEKKEILNDLANGKINFLIGTHSLFQKKVYFKNLGLAIIDEQHKFGVKQRIDLSNKGGKNCDVLLMSATPIPRSLILATYGDMDVSRLVEKPIDRKSIITLSKPENKLNEILPFIKKQIFNKNQVFWVCPLIKESKKLDFTASIDRYNFLKKYFIKRVGLIHGELEKKNKDKVLQDFLERKIDILVSTTVIEVGIDFPNASLIIIENSNKFGLSQLHQLRGRVGRGRDQGNCVLLYKNNLSENAKKRIKILKASNDGFLIAEEDMRLRGFGDVLGYQQSGIKFFRLADPVHHEDLFKLAEKNIKEIELNEKNFKRYSLLLKLFDKVDIINQINLDKTN
jgi:ATP-dependent DNA helicase RecG